MELLKQETVLSRILALAAGITTVFIISGSVTDPVNVPKLLTLGVFSCASASVLFASKLRFRLKESKFAVFFVLSFLVFSFITVLNSDSPFTQNFYGSYGRNNGFLTYLFLAFLLISALTLRQHFDSIAKSLILAGIVNVAYCLWVVSFGDFIGWSNPYGNILGTFGNPNFIGSFLGIFFAASLSMALNTQSKKSIRVFFLLILPVTAYEILKSHAIQGRVVAALGAVIVGFLYIKANFGKTLLVLYSALSSIIGVLSILGALQIGPLTEFIYKTSVSLRGQYWLAGWNTGKSHPFFGVGMDSFGDWYRRSRDAHALVLPGPNTVVNASHNVPIDMFAFGGWPLFATYILIMGLALLAVVKVVLRTKTFDSTIAILVSAWIGYQVQSIISINQIGLAIWGWLLSGVLISYEISTRATSEGNQNSLTTSAKPKRKIELDPRLLVLGTIGGLVGLLLALPPLIADSKWRAAQLTRNVQPLEETMVPGYFNPQNGTKYLANIQALEQSGLFELSHKYALEAVSWNSESFDLWKALFLVKNSTTAEKNLALENMKRLDPLNPDVTLP